MQPHVYRYDFQTHVSMEEVESSLLLAMMGAESLHGESQTRLEAAHAFDSLRKTCVIDASTPVGCDINKLFVGFLQREFGADSFTVRQVASCEPEIPLSAAL